MKNSFSIVIPVFNRAEIVCHTLDSIKVQTYRPIHLILVDNNSSDNSLDVIQQWKNENESSDFKITITTETIPGAAAARNKGLELVDTPLMAFFDSDDFMRSDCIETYANTFSQNQDSEIVCSNSLYHFINGKTRLFHFRNGNVLHNHIYHAILKTAGFAIKTDYIRSCGTWDSSVLAWDDWELGIRLLLNSPKVISTNKTLTDIYMQPDSITGLDFSSKAGRWEYALNKADESIENSNRVDKKTLHRLIDYRRIVLAAHYLKEGRKDLANELYHSTICSIKNDKTMRILMPLVYRYVSLGGRGAATIIDKFL